jgi:hypothetical protein
MKRPKSQVVKDLRSKLHTAIELEHSTIPPYMYAYWSVKDPTSETAKAILEVAKEEMNHMAMACNIMNAVGGYVNCANPNFIPSYPTDLPGHSQTVTSMKIGLHSLSIQSIVGFMYIELPRDPNEEADPEDGWTSIADFYLDVLADIDELDDEDFNHGRQLNNTDSPDASGFLISVNSKLDAKLCIAEIIEQGEGLKRKKDNENRRLKHLKSHFERFYDIYKSMGGYGEVDYDDFNPTELMECVDDQVYQHFMKGVYPMISNPGATKIDATLYNLENLKFNSLYSHMLDNIHTQKEKAHPDMSVAIQTMFSLGRHAAALRSIKLNDGLVGGPSFEYIERKNRF